MSRSASELQRRAAARSVRPINKSVNAPPARPEAMRAGLNINLNQNWEFQRLDGNSNGTWAEVHLPHSVRLEPLNASGCRNFQGECVYRKELVVPRQWEARILYLRFDGAMQVAHVSLNDRAVAVHHGGYTPFTIDITPFVRFGQPNSLTVRLDNRDDPTVPPGKPQRELDFTYFGGLYRGVHLDVLDRLHLTDPILADTVAGGGVFITYPHIAADSAQVRVRSDVQNEHGAMKSCTVRHELLDAGDVVIAETSEMRSIDAGTRATFDQTFDVRNPKLWHPHHPNLYALRTLVLDGHRIADEQLVRIGIRHVRFDKDSGLFLNGERFQSIGANRHQDHPYVGYALPDSAHWRDVKKLREAGFTSFRSHYPQAPAFMDACDELGMLAIVSNPGWQFIGDEIFRDRAIANARTMVRRDRNRPCVVLWEAALNESDNRQLVEALHRTVHEEYPGDQCYTAGDHERGSASPDASARAHGWDVEFLRNDGGKPYWIREWGDQVDNWSDQQSSSRVARGWGETPMLVQAASHLTRMNEIMVGHHGSDCGPGAARLSGACLWAGIDCQRGYHHQPFYGGVLDLFRLPKFDYYFFQSQRPPHIRVPGLDDGPMVFIANFATFLSPRTVTVFSNCEEVRLLQDGKEIARKRPDGGGHRVAHPPFTFEVDRFAPENHTMHMTGVADVGPPVGALRAEGLISGEVVAAHAVRPPGAPAKLMLEADLYGRDLIADGSDWVRVHARVCDAGGTVCPFADDVVTFDVAGEGSVLGDSSIGANPARAEAGIATALVRGTPRPGNLVIKATTFGLADAVLELSSKPLASTRLPEERFLPR